MRHPNLRRLLIASVAAACLPACSILGSDPEVKRDDKELHFDPEYYSQNAKEYFEGGHYARAKQQWQNQLKLEDNWMARLGVASCDYYMGSLSLDLGDIKGGRTRLMEAETAIRDLWDWSVEPSTSTSAGQSVRQWQAALILALTHRALGDCDNMEARIISQRLSSMKSDDERVRPLLKQRTVAETRRDENVNAATSLLARLCSMERPSERAVLNYAEVLDGSGDKAKSKLRFQEYLVIARSSVAIHQANLKRTQEMDGDPGRKEFMIREFQQKIASAKEKQSAVLVRLGNIEFEQSAARSAVATSEDAAAAAREQARKAAKDHLARAIQYLREAQELTPDALHILVKMAQCEGELGFFEDAIRNLDLYIKRCADLRVEANENIHRAYRMKDEFKRQLDARSRGGN